MLGYLASLALVHFAIATASCNASDKLNHNFIAGSTNVQVLTSNGTGSIIILDYDHEVEGIPSFEVLSNTGDTSLFEISYAESLAAFNTYMVSRHFLSRLLIVINAY
jgi:hypothetical protein